MSRRDRGLRWRRPRGRSWWLLAFAVLLSVAGAVAGNLRASLWSIAAATATVAVGFVVLDELRSRGQRADVRAAALGRHLRGVEEGSVDLPLVKDVSLNRMGVNAAIVEVDYVPRDKEVDAVRILQAGKPLLVVGHSMAGKTRMCAEVVRHLYPDWPLVLPERGESLIALADEGGTPERAVVWLNELNEFLAASGLTPGLLERLQSRGNKVVATMRASVYEKFLPTDQARPPGYEVLASFENVHLGMELTEHERNLVREWVTEPRVLAAVEQYGLAEYIGGGPDVIKWFNTGRSQNPAGAACVEAAADWRRAGLHSNIPDSVLMQLLVHYLPRHRQDDLALPGAIEDALAWARTRVNERLPLLERQQDGWRAFDFLVDHIEAEGRDIPRPTWLAIVQHTAESAEEASRAGSAAVRTADHDIAEALFRAAAQLGHAESKYWLSLYIMERGELEEAEHWYQQAPEFDTSAVGMHNLGIGWKLRGDTAKAEEWLRRASQAGSGISMGPLASLLQDRGALEEAERWCREAAKLGNTDQMLVLGAMLDNRGETEDAEQWYRRAARHNYAPAMFALAMMLERSGQATEADEWYARVATEDPNAIVNLGEQYANEGEAAEAERWYRRAARASDPNAMNSLGALLANRGDNAEAEQWFQFAAAADNLNAMVNLGLMLEHRGQNADAEHWYSRAAEVGGPDAMVHLGVLLADRGNDAEAERWYARAAETGGPDAMTLLADLLADRGEPADAEEWYRRAAGQGSASAMTGLGVMLHERGDIAEAERWWRQAAAREDVSAPEAMYSLGVLFEDTDPEASRDWYEKAANSGHLAAIFNLGGLLHATDPETARDWYEKAAKAGLPEAMNNLGLLLEDTDPETARDWYEKAAKAGLPEAMNNLGLLLEDTDPETARDWYEKAVNAGQ